VRVLRGARCRRGGPRKGLGRLVALQREEAVLGLLVRVPAKEKRVGYKWQEHNEEARGERACQPSEGARSKR